MRPVTLSALGILGALAVIAVVAGTGAFRRATPTTTENGWTEIAWPFPTDQWGQGKAFACGAADCGTPVTLYVRAKVGFCNCTTGVADDEELERISDFDIMGDKTEALGDGRPVTVAWMKGRSRAYAIGRDAHGRTGLTVGLNEHCDAIVATALVGEGAPATVEPKVLAMLGGRSVLRWAEVALGL